MFGNARIEKRNRVLAKSDKSGCGTKVNSVCSWIVAVFLMPVVS